MNWADHILILLFGVVFPFVAVRNARSGQLQRMHFDTENKKMLYYSNSMMLWIMATMVLFNWWMQGRSLGKLGLQWGQLPFSNYAWILLGSFVLLYTVDIFFEIGNEPQRAKTLNHFREKVGFLPANATEYGHFTFLAFTAGVCEEIVFRGFFITYLLFILSGQSPQLQMIAALTLPALSFAVAHLYQGWKAVVKIIAMAILFGAFFVETQMLWPLILVHIVVDLLGGLISWSLYIQEKA